MEDQILKMMPLNSPLRLVLLLIATLGLAAAFLFQNFDVLCFCDNPNGFYEFNHSDHNEVNFAINKLLRYILNNVSAALIIHIVFMDIKFSKAVILIQTLVLIIFFPLYFYFAFSNVLLLTQLYQKLNIILLNPIIPFILGISYYFKRRKL
jgi:hypothetical protein